MENPAKPINISEHSTLASDSTGEATKLLQLVLSSRTFAKSVRLASFLEFICQRTLEGKAREINEQQIGIHVFSRSPDYSASDDSIVRTQARLLRLKLEEYFKHEAPDSPMVISIPKGGYVPVFVPRIFLSVEPISVPEKPTPASGPESASAENVSPAAKTGRMPWLPVMVLVVLAPFIFWAGYSWWKARENGPSHGLWSSIFSPGHPVIIVPSDDALVLYQELTQTSVTLDEYLSGSYIEHSTARIGSAQLTSDWFASHQYTSSADLNLTIRLSRLPEAAKGGLEARNARVLRMDDLKSSNAILIGGVGANPWVGLFVQRLNFDVNYDWKTSQGYVRNKHPQNGEATLYLDTVSNGSRRSYGVLALLPGIGDDSNVLLFEGTGMAGTESAADFPFNPRTFANFARQIGATPGHIPYFEALLETTSIGGNAPEARLIAYRVIKP